MQRLTCVSYTRDNRYILSGSDEMNVRLWKARAAEKLGLLKERQRQALNYNEKLKEKFAEHPKIKRISKHRQVPKHVLHASREHRIIRESQKRKQANVRAHSKPGSVPYVAERDRHVIDEQE
jgi:WD repeat and SOF domain-containing protein 1